MNALKPEELTLKELRRVHDAIRRSYPVAAARSTIRAVGFGHALKGGRRDPKRRLAACFYVRQKRDEGDIKSVPVAQRVEETFTTRVKRDKHFYQVTIPTDVATVPRFAPARHSVTRNGGTWLGSAGAVVAWRFTAQEPWQLGVLTAGHLFENGTSNLALQIGRDGGAMPVTVRFRAPPSSLLDAALIDVTRAELAALNVHVPANPPNTTFWSTDDLGPAVTNAHATGTALDGISLRPHGDDPDFRTEDYFPESDDLIPELGNLADIVWVKERVAGTANPAAFLGGTSGSAWEIQGLPAATQVGRDTDTETEGLGQCIDTQLQWVRERLGAPFFRFVFAF